MNRSALKDEIIREVKLENRKVIGMTSENITAVVDFQFSYIREVMERGDYEGVRLPYFGKFFAKIERIKALTNETFRRKREQSDDQSGAQAGA